jgi:hypothetical protein
MNAENIAVNHAPACRRCARGSLLFPQKSRGFSKLVQAEKSKLSPALPYRLPLNVSAPVATPAVFMVPSNSGTSNG